ncbi:hypothetical protein EI94DRAFT_1756652, partial [Lactarius quietus]
MALLLVAQVRELLHGQPWFHPIVAGMLLSWLLLLPFSIKQSRLPIMLGMFFGVKKLCPLPLEGLHWSGVSSLPDLTDPDPFYVLLIAAAVLMNVQLKVRASMCRRRRYGCARGPYDCGSH